VRSIHDKCQGSEAKPTEGYTWEMTDAIHNALKAHATAGLREPEVCADRSPALAASCDESGGIESDFEAEDNLGVASAAPAPDDDEEPRMPLVNPCDDHRERVLRYMPEISACVSRLMTPSEIKVSKRAQQAILDEGKGLRDLGAWDEVNVRERSDVVACACRTGKTVHSAKLLSICSEKHSELPDDDIKARTVFMGSFVRDEHNCQGIFADVA
jgi:hypothetical protein